MWGVFYSRGWAGDVCFKGCLWLVRRRYFRTLKIKGSSLYVWWAGGEVKVHSKVLEVYSSVVHPINFSSFEKAS